MALKIQERLYRSYKNPDRSPLPVYKNRHLPTCGDFEEVLAIIPLVISQPYTLTFRNNSVIIRDITTHKHKQTEPLT